MGGILIALRAQCLLVVAGMMLVVVPPADGMMLIVPVKPARLAATVDWALSVGAFPTAPGPLVDTIVVRGSRAALLPAAIAHGALLIAAPVRTCGASEGIMDDE